MKAEQLQILADSLREEADRLWGDMEKTNRLPVIQPHNVISLTGQTVGRLRGWAEILEWHAKHEE